MILPTIFDENVFVPAIVWFPLVSTTFPESLASGTVPVERLDASRLVSVDPFPINVPLALIFPVTSSFSDGQVFQIPTLPPARPK